MSVRDVLLFAGQGSSTVFDEGLSTELRAFVESSTLGSSFLSACLCAFRIEVSQLESTERTALPNDILETFSSPISLAGPPKALVTNPVVQSISLYVHQILEYLRYADTVGENSRTLSETSGFCSGLLAAVIAATTQKSAYADLLRFATGGFRLAFWIGLRVAQACTLPLRDSPTAHLPWSIVVSGLEKDTLNKLIIETNETEKSQFPICIAAVLAQRTFTLIGQSDLLSTFSTKYLPASASTRTAWVYGYYHSNSEVSALVKERVINDVQRRAIEYPDWDQLDVPIRSTINGKHMSQADSHDPLLHNVLDCMLTHKVDWYGLIAALFEDTNAALTLSASSEYRVIALGPNSNSLLSGLRVSANPRLTVLTGVPPQQRLYNDADVAIVGMEVNFPSGKGIAQFWETMRDGLNVVQEIPPSRFDIKQFWEDGASTPNASKRKTKSRFGNFVNDPFDFDNVYFQISPREARSMDPQQRMLLHTALHALDDAGYAPGASDAFDPKTFGVYVGVATEDYVQNAREDIDVYYSTGTLRAFLSGRISYAFNFEGPSVVVDTACSSSTAAIYQACRALRNGDCTAALAGGVNVITSPDMHIGLGRAHFLNNTGQCKPFDVSADGYCRAEGCALFVLKRASDALRDGDRVYGTIRGIEVNQCGTSKSITFPDAPTQQRLFQKLLNISGIEADSISVIEAHGTGTQAGDHTEINSIRSTFGSRRKRAKPLYISSVKGNIGHAEAASGAAGLAKILLMMRNKQIPPQAAHRTINPRLGDLKVAQLQIPTILTPWSSPNGHPRRALLNNFGAAGSNVGVVVEEFVPTHSEKPAPVAERKNYLLNLSARTERALQSLCSEYFELFARKKRVSAVRDICYSATARRMRYDPFRLSINIDTEAESSYSQLQRLQTPTECSRQGESMIAFVFSGQGAVHQGMASDLFTTAPIFREAILQCDSILVELGYPTISSVMSKTGDALHDTSAAENTILSQCASFGLQYALSKLWISFGVVPDVAIGHSLGEYAMITASGMLDLRESLSIVAHRAKLMCVLCEPAKSGMTAVHAPVSQVEALMASNTVDFADLDIACINSPRDCVIAGSLKRLESLESALKSDGCKTKRLPVPFGFHSCAMDLMLEEFRSITSSLRAKPPSFMLISSTLRRLMNQSDICSDNFVQHARGTVDFAEACKLVDTMAKNKAIIFIEIGPAPITLPMVKASLPNRPVIITPSLKNGEHSWVTMNKALGVLFEHRREVHWREVFRGSDARFCGDIPRYPLFPSTFVIPYKESQMSFLDPPKEQRAESALDPYAFISRIHAVRQDEGDYTQFATPIERMADYIVAHSVGGAPLCPASVYMELASQARDLQSEDFSSSSTIFNDISFEKPLLYNANEPVKVMTSVDTLAQTFKVSSGGSSIHCTGRMRSSSPAETSNTFVRLSSFVKRQLSSVTFDEVFSSRTIYEVIFPRVVRYSGPFLTLKRLSIAPSGLECFGTFKLPSNEDRFHTAPAFIDTLLHAAGFVANSKSSAEEACICTHVEEAIVPRGSTIPLHEEMSVYCSLVDGVQGYIIADAYALDASKNVCAAVTGMHFKILRLRSFQAHLASITGKPPKLDTKTPATNKAPLQASHPKASTKRTPKAHDTQSGPMSASVVLKIVSDVCGAHEEVTTGTSLASLGIDSLLFIELTQKLEQAFPAFHDISRALQECSSIADVVALVETQQKANESELLTASDDTGDDGPSSYTASGASTPATSVSIPSSNVEALDDFMRSIVGVSMEGLDRSVSLSSLGVDSLLSIEIQEEFQTRFGVDLGGVQEKPIDALTIAQLQDVITESSTEHPHSKKSKKTEHRSERTTRNTSSLLTDSGEVFGIEADASDCKDTASQRIVPLHRSDGEASSLYLFHDGSGTASVYARLSNLPCNLFGIASADFDNVDNGIDSLPDLARRTVVALNLERVDNLILGGWSFGGVLAFEIARQLRAEGRKVRGLILIDSPSPMRHQPLPDTVIDAICAQIPARTSAAQTTRRAVETQFKRNAKLLGSYNPSSEVLDIPCWILQCREVVDTVALYGVQYSWLSDRAFRQNGLEQWKTLLKGHVQTAGIDGNHFNLFQAQHIRSVSEAISSAVKDFAGRDG